MVDFHNIMHGLAFDVGQNLSSSGRNSMRNLAISSGIWNYVEPAADTPRWVHFDERQVISGYPTVRRGSRGVYVCVLQDSLMALGYNTGGLDGVFGPQTYRAVVAYQRSVGLAADGIIGCNTWRSLQESVVGTGKTSTTINS